jgi:hypothetical protein
LPADRNLHLEGNGFVVLERDNLAVEGDPYPDPSQYACSSKACATSLWCRGAILAMLCGLCGTKDHEEERGEPDD